MKNNNNNHEDWSEELYSVTGETLSFINYGNYGSYKVNVDAIKTIDDIKLILKHLNLNYSPSSKEDYEVLKHLLIIN